jgi:hypothetical protein
VSAVTRMGGREVRCLYRVEFSLLRFKGGIWTDIPRSFPQDRMKMRGDVVQLVKTLPCHPHNDVRDLKISNLVQPTSVRPVTVSAISLHF